MKQLAFNQWNTAQYRAGGQNNTGVAQLVEQWFPKPKVSGSWPDIGAMKEQKLICGNQFTTSGDVCRGELKLVAADEPWHDEYYICERCYSTYNKFERDQLNHDDY